MILHSKIYGNHEKHLLIFHGLFGMSDNWHSFAQKLSIFYTIHTIDLRNHGKSFHTDEMNFEAMSQDILNYISYHKIENYSLLGHSLGGKIIMEFALNNKNKNLEKLIIVDITPKAYPPHHQGIIKAISEVNFSEIQTRKEVENILKQYIKELEIIQFLLKNLYWKENKTLAFRFNLKSITENYNNLISTPNTQGKVENNTLFLIGEKSNYIIEEDKIIINDLFLNVDYKIIKNAGHWIHADNPEEFYNEIIKFLSP